MKALLALLIFGPLTALAASTEGPCFRVQIGHSLGGTNLYEVLCQDGKDLDIVAKESRDGITADEADALVDKLNLEFGKNRVERKDEA